MATWPTSLGNPNLPSAVGTPGYKGFRDALNAYINLAGGPLNKAMGQLSGAAASDPSGTQYQQGTQELGGPNSGGRGEGAAAGLFGQLAAGQGGANAQGQAVQQAGTQAALKGVATTDLNAASAVAQQEQARLAMQNAQNRQSGNDLALLQAGIGQLGPQGLFGTLANKGGGASANSPWANLYKLGQGGLQAFGNWGAGTPTSITGPMDPGTGPVAGGLGGLGGLTSTDIGPSTGGAGGAFGAASLGGGLGGAASLGTGIGGLASSGGSDPNSWLNTAMGLGELGFALA